MLNIKGMSLCWVLFASAAAARGVSLTTPKHEWVCRKGSVVVLVKAGFVPVAMCSGSLYWGWQKEPAYVINDVEIKYKSHDVQVPLSCYADLSQVDDVQLLQKKGGKYVLIIGGGDASTGYETKIFFDSKNVYRREVHDGEESEYHYEITTYVNKTPPP